MESGDIEIEEMLDFYYGESTMLENAIEFGARIKNEKSIDNLSIIDFGSGAGYVGLQLIERASKVIFVDTDGSSLKILKTKIEHDGIENGEIFCDVIERYEGPNVDVAVCSLSLHHVQDLNSTLRSLYSIMKPRGVIFVNELVRKVEIKGLDPSELKERIEEAGFTEVLFDGFGVYRSIKSLGMEVEEFDRFFLKGKKK